ncbi:hypothetical protein [Sandaracinus amylolyticus]|uniref:hypothetical protein n=1 Tax=Sandaracinus amylolyticus TaxID=927083 RepID=UPI001F3F807C|nr:hypothetical protein [Sandaracinus amylolyticus]UJR78191.1 Hypothetical protein I5071_2180 [Sandaracinus amylolyticus]
MALLATIACAIVTAPVHAQPPADDTTRARELFRRGVDAADAGRWEDARALFEETYALLPRPQVLLNLAGARAQTGRLVAAVEAYARVESGEGGASDALREAARDARAMLEPRVPRLVVDFHGTLVEGDVVQLDEGTLPSADDRDELRIDPGRHAVMVTRGGVEVLREDFRLYEGERLRLDLRVSDDAHRGVESETELPPLQIPTRRREEWFESPIFWTIVGIVAAGAVGIGVAVAVSDEDEEPFVGNLEPGTIRVR